MSVCWSVCRDLWRVLSWWFKCIKLFLHLSLSPGELFWGIFSTILCIHFFLFFLYFLRIIQLLHIKFFTNIPSITLRITSLKKNFRRISNFVGSHFGIFWGSFWDMFLYSSELLGIFWAYFLMKLCTYVFCITLTVNVLRTFLQHTSLYWEDYTVLLGLFWVYFSWLKKLKTSSWYFTQMSWYCCDGH